MCQRGVAGVTHFFVRLSSSKPPSGQTCSGATSERNSKERSCYSSKHRQDVELTWGSSLRSMKSCLPFFYHVWCRWQDAPPATEHKMAAADIAIACHAWTIAVKRSHQNIILYIGSIPPCGLVCWNDWSHGMAWAAAQQAGPCRSRLFFCAQLFSGQVQASEHVLSALQDRTVGEPRLPGQFSRYQSLVSPRFRQMVLRHGGHSCRLRS